MKDWGLALLVLLPEILIFYRKVIFSAHYVIPWDFRYYHLPLTTFIASSWRAGQFPLWDPYTYCGLPFFANINAQIFYPPISLVPIGCRISWNCTWRRTSCWAASSPFCCSVRSAPVAVQR